ncbi:hypothetical protein CASFOL_040221 [Castilleja foliolosa]|uniref:B3 domain-containing protein n=1 Tax=Castilleja foliolosa TaxID=1961234 RepID=A0ABD3BF27_9LAMI
MYTSIQESDGDVDTTLGLAVPEHHHHHHGIVRLINLSEFLILGGKTINANPKPVDKAPAINLAKILEDTPSDFLGLGIDASSNYKIDHGRQIVALNPNPLRSFHPKFGFMDFSTTQSLQASSSSSSSSTGKKRIREKKDNNVKKERAKRSRVDEYPEPTNPSPELLQRIGPTARPVFLYRKQLVESDILKDQNRLYVNYTKKLMLFLTEEEGEQVKNGKLGFVGIDRMGREYELSFTRWGRVTIINKDWSKMIVANQARAEHWVHIWGYRCGDDKFRLAFDFHQQLNSNLNLNQ